MSEGAPEGGGAPLSDGQFGDTTDAPTPDPGPTAQSPGSGIFTPGWYPWGINVPRRRKKRKRTR